MFFPPSKIASLNPYDILSADLEETPPQPERTPEVTKPLHSVPRPSPSPAAQTGGFVLTCYFCAHPKRSPLVRASNDAACCAPCYFQHVVDGALV